MKKDCFFSEENSFFRQDTIRRVAPTASGEPRSKEQKSFSSTESDPFPPPFLLLLLLLPRSRGSPGVFTSLPSPYNFQYQFSTLPSPASPQMEVSICCQFCFCVETDTCLPIFHTLGLEVIKCFPPHTSTIPVKFETVTPTNSLRHSPWRFLSRIAR